MVNKLHLKKGISVALLLLAIVSIHAQDRLFTYTYQSGVLNKGQREIEVTNTFLTGKNDYYTRFDNRTEYEVGLAKNLQTAFYINLSSINETNIESGLKTIGTEHSISFSNEWKYKLLDPVADPVGLAIYGEYGIGAKEYELEGKVIVDKKMDKITLAANAVYEYELTPGYDANTLVWEKEHKPELYASAAYELKPGLNLTAEAAFRNVIMDSELVHSAVYAGLGISYAHDNFLLNFTVLPQVAAFKGQTNSTLNLNEYEKLQCRLLFSYAL